jgi:nucleoid-associated protein YgaU
VKIQPKTHAPPRLTFIWGEGLAFRAIVESVTEKFTLFNPLGVPLRATLSVAFREYKTLEQQLEELNLQTADRTGRHSVLEGDTLPGIAWQHYRDASQWRLIADQNADRVPNPRRLIPGTVLLIPRIDPAVTRVGRGA